MFEIFNKPIKGTPNISALKFGMALSVMTLLPGLIEILIGLLVSIWLVYIASSAGLEFAQHAHHPEFTARKRAL